MSDFSCTVFKVGELEPVPKADLLLKIEACGFPVLVKRGEVETGDLAVYIPEDSVIDLTKPWFAFVRKNDKTSMRVKAIRLRGVYSEGLVVRLSNVTGTSKVSVGDDLAEVVGAVKYEEQAPDDRSGVRLGAEAASDPKFLPRYSVEPWLRNKDSLPIGSQVVVTEKIHGCNFRAGVKNGKLHVGSHFVFQKDPRTSRVFSRLKSFVKKYAPRGWFLKFTEVAPTSVFWKVAIDNDLETKLKAYDGWGLYGEVYGKVQDLKYSVSENDQVKLVIFDVRKPDGNFLSMLAAREFTENLGLQFVPILHVGGLTEKVLELRNGTSELDGATMREGIVIRPILEESGSRRILLKYVGENYKLRKDGTERH